MSKTPPPILLVAVRLTFAVANVLAVTVTICAAGDVKPVAPALIVYVPGGTLDSV